MTLKYAGFVLTPKELKKLIGKWITFKIWNCGALDHRRRYTGKVLIMSCSTGVIVNTIINKDHRGREIKVGLYCTQIERANVRILSPEEVIIMKLKKE